MVFMVCLCLMFVRIWGVSGMHVETCKSTGVESKRILSVEGVLFVVPDLIS